MDIPSVVIPFTGRIDPRGDIIRAQSDLTCWFFLWDDQHDRLVLEGSEEGWHKQATQFRAVINAPETAELADDPAPRALGDILHRIRAQFSDVWWRRHAQHVTATVDEAARQGLHGCLLSMRDWIADMDGWHRMSARYLDADIPVEAPVEATVACGSCGNC